jgi:hypothetical protein
MVTVLLMAVAAVACTTVGPPGSGQTSPGATSSGDASASAATTAPGTVASGTLAPGTIAPATLAASSGPTDAPTRTAKPSKPPTPTPTAEPAKIKTFTAPETIDCNVDPIPSQIHIEWSVARATGVTLSIDSGGLYDSYSGADGTADVAFACGEAQHEYTLTTTGGAGAPATKSVTVKRAEPRIRNVYADNLTLDGTCTMVYQRRVYWNVENATGVTVTVGGQAYGPYMGHDNNDLFPYDCRTSETVTYHVETTGFGPAATFDYVLPYAIDR